MILVNIRNVKLTKQTVILTINYALKLFSFWKKKHFIVTFPQKILHDIMYFFLRYGIEKYARDMYILLISRVKFQYKCVQIMMNKHAIQKSQIVVSYEKRCHGFIPVSYNKLLSIESLHGSYGFNSMLCPLHQWSSGLSVSLVT